MNHSIDLIALAFLIYYIHSNFWMPYFAINKKDIDIMSAYINLELRKRYRK